jgi:membrane associated rhomboid family serine protease
MFVHATWWHIIVNMVSLYFLGSFLLRAVGERNFLAVFLLGGLAGNICYVVFGPSFTTAVGASGAIYALGGTLAVLAPSVPVLVFPIPVPVPLWAAIVIFLFISFLPGIAWQAHLGGLLSGLVAGVLLRRRRRIYFF